MSTTPPASSGPDEECGPLLRSAREAAGLNQSEVSRLVDVSQPQLSRYERGFSRPKADDVRVLADLYVSRDGITPREADRLVSLAESLADNHVDRRVVLQAGGAHNFQLRIRKLEEGSRTIRSFHPTMVLGVLQTRALAAAVFTPDEELTPEDAARAIDARMARVAALTDEGRTWHLIQTEQALRWPVRDYGLHADLLAAMVETSRRPNVDLRVIPLDTLAPAPAPLSGFHLYDDRVVQVGTDLGTTTVDTESRVRGFVSLFEDMTRLALSPEASRELLLSLARDYREKASSRP